MTDDGPDPFASAGDRPDDLESTFRLIDRARTGDPDALERLMQRHLGPLRRWARGRLPQWARDAADTDDLVQDTLLRTFKSLDDFEVRGAGALQAYLRTAIQNRVRDELRKRSRRPEAVGLDGREPDHGQSPLEASIGRENLERYERALATLEPAAREAIIGRIEMGYSYAGAGRRAAEAECGCGAQGRPARGRQPRPADERPRQIIASLR